VAVTPANVSESRYFEQAIEGVETSRYYADKGSASAENRAILKKKGIRSGIMYAACGQTPRILAKGLRLVSKVRFKV
jgi:IS5 family transposase